MKISKGIILLLLIPIIGIIESCCKCENTNALYRITEVRFQAENIFVATNDSLKFHLYPQDSLISISQNFNSGIISSAYACSCDETKDLTAEITAIRMFTNQDFSAEYPKNSNIDSIVYATLYDGGKDSLLSFSFVDFISFNANRGNGNYDPLSFFYNAVFIFKKRPSMGNTQSFRLEFTLSDGRILKTETPIIEWE